ncbi:MAG: hypothetical protein WDN04_15220 [Rhodospirillales bacterium]
MRNIAMMAAICGGLLTLVVPAQAKPGAAGWQAPFTLTVTTGSPDTFWHIACPTGYYVENGAAFAVNQATVGNGFVLTGAGPRLDETPPDYSEWAWNFEWPAGGAPAGSQIIMNVYCKKGKP